MTSNRAPSMGVPAKVGEGEGGLSDLSLMVTNSPSAHTWGPFQTAGPPL